MRASPSPLRPGAWLLAFAIFGLSQWLLLTNPGYFSHDELQWGGFAGVDRWADLPWVGWTDVGAFQYRPLTFNLWLLLSWIAFDAPLLMHATWIALGFTVCALLYRTLRGAGAEARIAVAGAAAFALNPFAAYVHGWVATLGELLWVGAGLGIALVVLDRPRGETRAPALIGLGGTTLALLSKEAALAITPLLALAWLLSGRELRWSAASLGSSVSTLVYLALRLPLLLHAPRPEGAYAWSLTMLPQRWAEMQAYPFLVTALELPGVAQASATRLVLAASVATLLALCTWRAGPRLAAGYLVGGACAIGPALVLAVGYPQYGYGYSALACGCLALGWSRLKFAGRSVLALALLLSTWHGMNVQREMRRVGELQARFSPALAQALVMRPQTVRLRVEHAPDRGIYERLTRNLPHPAGATGSRVELVEGASQADYRIESDGSIVADER